MRRTTWNVADIVDDIATRAAAADDETRLEKAKLAVAVAERMLPDADADVIEDQAVSLMYMPHDDLMATHTRLLPRLEDHPMFTGAPKGRPTVEGLSTSLVELWRQHDAALRRIEALETRLDEYDEDLSDL